MRIVLFIILATALTSCKKERESVVFDKVVHHHLDISPEQTFSLLKSQKAKDTILGLVINDYLPRTLNDSVALTSINDNFKKNRIPRSLNRELAKCFSFDDTKIETSCEPFYRDILIFYRKEKVVGIAKICLECKETEFIGFKYNWKEDFIKVDFNRLIKVFKVASS